MNASNPRDIGELARLAVGAAQAVNYVSAVLQRLGPVQERLTELQRVIVELEQTIQNFEAARASAAQGAAGLTAAPPATRPASSTPPAAAEAEPDRAPPAPEVSVAEVSAATQPTAAAQHIEAATLVEDNLEIQAEATTLGSSVPEAELTAAVEEEAAAAEEAVEEAMAAEPEATAAEPAWAEAGAAETGAEVAAAAPEAAAAEEPEVKAAPEVEPARDEEGEAGGAINAPSRVSVTVFQADGPLDLVRVYNALSAVPGVGGLGIVSYARVRAVFQLTTDRRPSDLPLSEALETASNGGVHGRWLGEGEYLAEIGVAS